MLRISIEYRFAVGLLFYYANDLAGKFIMSLLPKEFINAVVSIGRKRTSIECNWFGTGFFVMRPEDSDNKIHSLFLVTNKHVLEGENSVVIRLKKQDSNDLMILDLPLYHDGERSYSVHPDENIDIAAVMLNAGVVERNNLHFYGYTMEKNFMDSAEYIEYCGYEGGDVYMIGFPMPQMTVGQYSNTPICRSGCIARMDPEIMKADKKFIIDIQNFPGNSGSPIIAKPEVAALTGMKPLNRAVLVGIVNSYIPYQERLINQQTKEVVEIRSENSGLALANPTEYIRETVEIEHKRVQKL